jgi:hypothetical protein
MPVLNVLQGNVGGLYYSRRNIAVGENGSCGWFGFDNQTNSWSNVFIGRWITNGQIIEGMEGQWCDVPWGNTEGFGTVKIYFQEGPSRRWRREDVSGGENSFWTIIAGRVPEFPPLPRGNRSFPSSSLSGVWQTDTGALYYIRELPDNRVFWFAARPDLRATHVASGRRADNRISINWLDIPPGNVRAEGLLSLEVLFDGIMVKRSSSASFGSSRWLKLS